MGGTKEVVEALQRLAFGYELLGANPMRIRAYSNGARTVKKFSSNLPEAYASGELAKIKGIGKGMLEVIGLVLNDQPVPALADLSEQIPEGLFEARRISGVGPKKILKLWRDLGLTSMGEIEYACNENRLVDLPGFGAKTQDKVLESIAALRERADTFRLDQIKAAVAALASTLAETKRWDVVGEVRRGCENASALELVVLGDVGGDVGATVEGVPVRIHRSTNAARYGVDLIRHTGSEAHVEALVARGLDDAVGETEEAVYHALGLELTPPERRETHVPLVERGGTQPELLTRADVQGALHNHTTASDGVHSLADMKRAATEAGLAYLGISDHSQTASYAGGLQVSQLTAQLEQIRVLNTEGGAHLLSGVESDILTDGSLDYEDEVLARLDFIVASIHNRARLDRDATTARYVAAARHRYSDCIGHPTGRLINGRPGNDFDVEAFLDACAEANTSVELNANPQRLDLCAAHLEMAKARGIKVSIAADAHSTMALSHLDYGISVARRAGLTAEDVINCWPLDRLQAWVGERRG